MLCYLIDYAIIDVTKVDPFYGRANDLEMLTREVCGTRNVDCIETILNRYNNGMKELGRRTQDQENFFTPIQKKEVSPDYRNN